MHSYQKFNLIKFKEKIYIYQIQFSILLRSKTKIVGENTDGDEECSLTVAY